MKKRVEDFEVLQRKELNKEHFILELKAADPLPLIKPGQFVNVLVEHSNVTFLRRPLSVHDVDYDRNLLVLFVKRVGEGTRTLGRLEAGDKLNVIYPLGNGFSIPSGKRALLVGGGCGVAPLLYLAKSLYENDNQVTTLLGVRSNNDATELDRYKNFGRILITTEDGSMGEKGFPTHHSVLENENFDIIFTCGPEPMMKAVAEFAKDKGITCEVSLENTMACGIGACLCCVTQTKDGNKCACTEGPVFNINDLTW